MAEKRLIRKFMLDSQSLGTKASIISRMKQMMYDWEIKEERRDKLVMA